MKKIIILLIFSISLIACEDPIDLDLNSSAPRLVIDAALELNGDNTTSATVLLTRSSPFFQEETVFVDNATVVVTDEMGTDFPFTLVDTGLYENINLNIQDGESYTLTIIDGDDTYTANQNFISTVPYTRVEQTEVSGIDDLTEIAGFFNDPISEENYYLFEYIDINNIELDIIDDEFSNGNEALTAFFIEDLIVGTEITLSIRGIDRRGFTFYDTLIQQTDDDSSGPFDTQPATVRGNIINITNPENFPFGYFRVSQKFEIKYTAI